jgi:hypothetical protein
MLSRKRKMEAEKSSPLHPPSKTESIAQPPSEIVLSGRNCKANFISTRSAIVAAPPPTTSSSTEAVFDSACNSSGSKCTLSSSIDGDNNRNSDNNSIGRLVKRSDFISIGQEVTMQAEVGMEISERSEGMVEQRANTLILLLSEEFEYTSQLMEQCEDGDHEETKSEAEDLRVIENLIKKARETL